jgi:hypothetical protein
MKPTKELHVTVRVPLKDYSLFVEAVTEYVPDAEEISSDLVNIEQSKLSALSSPTQMSKNGKYRINRSELDMLKGLINQYPNWNNKEILEFSGIPCSTEIVRKIRHGKHPLQLRQKKRR